MCSFNFSILVCHKRWVWPMLIIKEEMCYVMFLKKHIYFISIFNQSQMTNHKHISYRFLLWPLKVWSRIYTHIMSEECMTIHSWTFIQLKVIINNLFLYQCVNLLWEQVDWWKKYILTGIYFWIPLPIIIFGLLTDCANI